MKKDPWIDTETSSRTTAEVTPSVKENVIEFEEDNTPAANLHYELDELLEENSTETSVDRIMKDHKEEVEKEIAFNMAHWKSSMPTWKKDRAVRMQHIFLLSQFRIYEATRSAQKDEKLV